MTNINKWRHKHKEFSQSRKAHPYSKRVGTMMPFQRKVIRWDRYSDEYISEIKKMNLQEVFDQLKGYTTSRMQTIELDTVYQVHDMCGGYMLPDYKQRVLSLVHDIRVNPFDDSTRLILADLISEHGRPSAENNTCKILRNGQMICNSLDMKCVNELSKWIVRLTDSQFIPGLNSLLTEINPHLPLISIVNYNMIWNFAYFVKGLLFKLDVVVEVEAINVWAEKSEEHKLWVSYTPKSTTSSGEFPPIIPTLYDPILPVETPTE